MLRRHRADDTVTKAIARVLRADLVVVDDIGLLPVAQDAAEGLYRLVDAAYEKRSVAISSNLHPAAFDELMPKTLATATGGSPMTDSTSIEPSSLRPRDVVPPPWIADLPTDRRGFFVPAEAGWPEDGEPAIAVVETARKVGLAIWRPCAVCGHHMPRGQPVYRAFSQVDAAQIRGYEREQSQDLSGPLHKSCVLYSAMVCPYLRERTSRLGKASMIKPGARRGTLAAVMGFRDMALLLFAGPHQPLAPGAPLPHVGYLGLCDDIKYRDGDELADLYADAVDADSALIDVSAERNYWRHDDMPALERRLWDELTQIARRPVDYKMTMYPANPYVGFYL